MLQNLMPVELHSPIRRTQEERRNATRGALLEATIATLVEQGYRGTTTLAVERRAGVSRGARIHHFANKAALLGGVADYLYEQLSDFYAEAFDGLTRRQESDIDRLRHGLRELWEIYQRPHFTAVLELNMAARTDPELQQALLAVAHRHRQLALDAAKNYFPVLHEHQSRTLIEVIHASFVGMRMQMGVTADPESLEYVLLALEDCAATQLLRQISSERGKPC
jgi:AcrR family transcriptional regulator